MLTTPKAPQNTPATNRATFTAQDVTNTFAQQCATKHADNYRNYLKKKARA